MFEDSFDSPEATAGEHGFLFTLGLCEGSINFRIWKRSGRRICGAASERESQQELVKSLREYSMHSFIPVSFRFLV